MTRRRTRFLALAVGTSAAIWGPVPARAAASLIAQDTIRVGDRRLQGRLIQPYRRTARQIVTRPDGTVLNARQVLTDELQELTVGSRKLLRRTVILYRFDGQPYAADTTDFDPATMASISTVERVNGSTAWRRSYDRLRVYGQRLSASTGGSGMGAADGDPALAFETTLPFGVFDYYGGMEGLLFAALPLSDGARGTLPVFDDRENRAAWLDYRVVGQAPVEAGPGRMVQAWIVETPIRDGVTTAWVIKEPPFVLKTQTVFLRDGKPNRIHTFLMIEPAR